VARRPVGPMFSMIKNDKEPTMISVTWLISLQRAIVQDCLVPRV
jgi:hypothetical protein